MLSLILIVCVFTVFIIFSKEFGGFLKKVFEIPMLILIIPLIIVTSILVSYEAYVLDALLYIKWLLVSTIHYLMALLPFRFGALVLVATPIILALCLLPSYVLNHLSLKRNRLPFYHTFVLSTMLWIFFIILVVS